MKNFYIPVYRNCAQFGNINELNEKMTVTHKDYNQCERNLPKCGSDD